LKPATKVVQTDDTLIATVWYGIWLLYTSVFSLYDYRRQVPRVRN